MQPGRCPPSHLHPLPHLRLLPHLRPLPPFHPLPSVCLPLLPKLRRLFRRL